MEPKHLISIRDLTSLDVAEVFRIASEVKGAPDKFRSALQGKTLALVFQRPSTRTRVSFQVAMYELGGLAVGSSDQDLQISRGESMADTARTLSRYVDAVGARTRAHADLVELSRNAGVPVINGLTDLLHPCQALADFFTLTEKKGNLTGRKLAYVGAGNHMCHSLLYGAIKAGMDIAVATPGAYKPKSIIVKSVNREAEATGATVVLTEDPVAAVRGADAVYTDQWVSVGQESDAEPRAQALLPYQITPELMSEAKPDACFMHCLPAQRGREVSAEVIDSKQSVIFDQAENRLHVAKAILLHVLSGRSRH